MNANNIATTAVAPGPGARSRRSVASSRPSTSGSDPCEPSNSHWPRRSSRPRSRSLACTDSRALKQENPGQLDASHARTSRRTRSCSSTASSLISSARTARYVVGSGHVHRRADERVSRSRTTSTTTARTLAHERARTATATCAQQAQQPPHLHDAVDRARPRATRSPRIWKAWTDAEVPNRSKLIGQASAYAGYSLVLLGEGMCSAAINVGPELTAGAALRRSEDAIRQGDRRGDDGERCGNAQPRDARSRAGASSTSATRPRPRRRRREDSGQTFVVNTSTDAVNVAPSELRVPQRLEPELLGHGRHVVPRRDDQRRARTRASP